MSTAPKPEDLDEAKEIKNIEFYQPVTVIIYSNDNEVLQALPRAVRPPDVVEKYMNEVFDTCRRADETFLAFRLPKEGIEERERGSMTPAVATPGPDAVGVGGDKKRGRGAEGTPGVEGGERKKSSGGGRVRKSLGEGAK